MTRARAMAWFAVYTLAVCGGMALVGRREAAEAGLACLLCALPLAITRTRPLAEATPFAKTSLQRRIASTVMGMPIRFAAVFGGAALAHLASGQTLGWAFWASVILGYQVVLGLSVAQRLALIERPRNASATVGEDGPERRRSSI